MSKNHINLLLFLYLQVELATGVFPYRDCTTEFEVLTKVMGEDPPQLPIEQDFSYEFSSFVNEWYDFHFLYE